MKRNIPQLLTSLLVCAAVCSCATREVTADYGVIPLPREVSQAEGEPFVLDRSTVICYTDTALQNEAGLLVSYINDLTGFGTACAVNGDDNGAIVLSLGGESDNPEAYELSVDKDRITVTGATPAGVFYGIQTLRKSIPDKGDGVKVLFPPVRISDEPRFAYRGAHLDVSRHFFTPDSIKIFIDMLALHNINRFHWHLTDDQGWRVEIKSRPLLTEVGSKRPGTCIGHDINTCDSVPYGGYYTQEQMRDIVRYAAERHIEVIPEIDLPGHMLAALKCYPELGCTGGPYEVWHRWGVSDDVLCAGNDSVLTFIDDVLGEIVELFPSEYIHIGGDECPKARWKECPKCQAKARELGLKAGPKGSVEEQLQSYVIHHASDFLTSRGRKMIGWDETLEGGLAPGAIVMSWQGEGGAKEAARQGHDAIMTPMNYMYFNCYQTLERGGGEPDANGGYLPVEMVYGFNPVPDDLTDEQKKHIIGVQANVWTEYIHNFSGVQYAELPRMAALSELQWTPADKRDYASFTARLPQMIAHYRANGYRYATHVFDVTARLEPDRESKCVNVTLSTIDNAPVYYTTDGTEPDESSARYDNTLPVDSTCVIKAVAIRPEGRSRTFTDSISFNKATCRDITLAHQPHPRYAADGPGSLVDGKFGSSSYTDGCWSGFQSVNLDATIDFGTREEVSSVTLRCLVETGCWIFDAASIEVQLSDDGKTFDTVAVETYPVEAKGASAIRTHTVSFEPRSARYMRVIAGPVAEMPSWHLAPGYPAFIFVDEIMAD